MRSSWVVLKKLNGWILYDDDSLDVGNEGLTSTSAGRVDSDALRRQNDGHCLSERGECELALFKYDARELGRDSTPLLSKSHAQC